MTTQSSTEKVTSSPFGGTVRPQDDLYGWANEQWLAEASIPDDRAAFGAFHELVEDAEQKMRQICERAAAGESADGAPSSVTTLVGNLYRSFLDTDRIDALGLSPLTDELAAVAAIENAHELVTTLGRLQRHGGHGLLEPFVITDADDPDRYLLHLEQSGLGLPDESYYSEERFAPVREAYVAHVAAMFRLAGPGAGFVGDPDQAARRVMDLETQIASHHWDVVATRDAVRTHNIMSMDELAALAPGLDWSAWFTALGASESATKQVVVRQPSFVEGLDRCVAEIGLAGLKVWCAWHVIHSHAAYLTSDIVEENFAFYGRTLSGTPELRARWKRAVSFVEHAAGEAAGQLYVAQHFPPEAKEAMRELVQNLVEAYRRNIESLEWMSPTTRQRALEKLASFRPKVGYPDTWRDYSGLQTDPTDLLGNVRRAAAFETDRELNKIGGPVDRGEWFMTPQTVNAYYNPRMNEIVFPAAILQPPFFALDADPADNYGGIGTVIGHEIGHGFDDQGSRYDGRGALLNWWTDADRERFEEKAAALIKQFDVLTPRGLPGHTVNGALTVGENIGDLGGVTIGYQAYRIAVPGADAVISDGLTGVQRFFRAYGRIWRALVREEEEVRRLATDPHSPAEFRANVVRNIHAFHEAFDVGPEDGLWLDEDDRVSIW